MNIFVASLGWKRCLNKIYEENWKVKAKLWHQQWHLCSSNNIRGPRRLSGTLLNYFPGNVKISKLVRKNTVVFSLESIYGFCPRGWKIDRYDSDYSKSPPPTCFHSSLKMIVLHLKEDANYIDSVKRRTLEPNNGRGVLY